MSMSISTEDLHWAAGFLEGEGSFTVVPAGKRADGRDRASFNVSVHCGQKDWECLERLQALFGGKIYNHNLHTKWPLFRWQIYGVRAVGIMMTLWTLMSSRRKKQIELAISRWKTNQPPNGKNHLQNVRRGENHPFAKLTAIQVEEIRSSSRSYTSLAKAYGVSPATIGKIKRREIRRGIEENGS